LNNICLLKSEGFPNATELLDNWKKRCNEKSRDGQLYMPTYICPVEKALEIGRYMDEFYEHIAERETMSKNGMRKEEIKTNVKKPSTADRPSTQGSELAPEDFDPVTQMMRQNAAKNHEIIEEEEEEEDELSDVHDSSISGGGSEEHSYFDETKEQPQQDEEEEDGGTARSRSVNGTGDNSTATSRPLTACNPQELQQFATLEEGDAMNEGDDASSHQGTASIPEGANEDGGEEEEEVKDEDVVDETDLELSADQQLKIRKKRIKEQKARLYALMHARGVSLHAKAVRFVEIIDETFNRLWIYARHLALIIHLFQQVFPPTIYRTEIFGSYVAEIVINLFARVVDLHNFELIYELLTPRDCAVIFCRLGLLNLFNPLKPEVTMELCLSRLEERKIAKIIIYLSVLEPGINLIYKRFQWKRELDPTPGWEVTDALFTDAGLYTHGYFAFTYYSGEGKNKMGCIPEIGPRRALCQLVLLNENEVYIGNTNQLLDREDNSSNNASNALLEFVNSAVDHFKNNQDLWLSYLLPNASEK
jgi:hypothetical protein